MLKDITLGQYFPGESFLHKLDARMKLILAIFYIVLIFVAKSVTSYLLMFTFTMLMIGISGIPFKTVLKSLKPLLIVLIFTMLINIFWSTGDTVLFSIGKLDIYLEGVLRAAAMALRIIMLMAGSSVLLMYTTSPISLTDALERLLAPLAAIKIPVHTFAMMMTMALRFIPTLLEETQKIINAQKARGADFDSGNIIKKAKALVPVLIPLLISQFRRAEELATAMECRCYRGGNGRTRMTITHFTSRDLIAGASMILLSAGVLILNHYFYIYIV